MSYPSAACGFSSSSTDLMRLSSSSRLPPTLQLQLEVVHVEVVQVDHRRDARHVLQLLALGARRLLLLALLRQQPLAMLLQPSGVALGDVSARPPLALHTPRVHQTAKCEVTPPDVRLHLTQRGECVVAAQLGVRHRTAHFLLPRPALGAAKVLDRAKVALLRVRGCAERGGGGAVRRIVHGRDTARLVLCCVLEQLRQPHLQPRHHEARDHLVELGVRRQRRVGRGRDAVGLRNGLVIDQPRAPGEQRRRLLRHHVGLESAVAERGECGAAQLALARLDRLHHLQVLARAPPSAQDRAGVLEEDAKARAEDGLQVGDTVCAVPLELPPLVVERLRPVLVGARREELAEGEDHLVARRGVDLDKGLLLLGAVRDEAGDDLARDLVHARVDGHEHVRQRVLEAVEGDVSHALGLGHLPVGDHAQVLDRRVDVLPPLGLIPLLCVRPRLAHVVIALDADVGDGRLAPLRCQLGPALAPQLVGDRADTARLERRRHLAVGAPPVGAARAHTVEVAEVRVRVLQQLQAGLAPREPVLDLAHLVDDSFASHHLGKGHPPHRLAVLLDDRDAPAEDAIHVDRAAVEGEAERCALRHLRVRDQVSHLPPHLQLLLAARRRRHEGPRDRLLGARLAAVDLARLSWQVDLEEARDRLDGRLCPQREHLPVVRAAAPTEKRAVLTRAAGVEEGGRRVDDQLELGDLRLKLANLRAQRGVLLRQRLHLEELPVAAHLVRRNLVAQLVARVPKVAQLVLLPLPVAVARRELLLQLADLRLGGAQRLLGALAPRLLLAHGTPDAPRLRSPQL
eukprot:7387663-Prymnesium_polylepis.2